MDPGLVDQNSLHLRPIFGKACFYLLCASICSIEHQLGSSLRELAVTVATEFYRMLTELNFSFLFRRSSVSLSQYRSGCDAL